MNHEHSARSLHWPKTIAAIAAAVALFASPSSSRCAPFVAGCNMWIGIDEESELYATCFGVCTVPNACVQLQGSSGGVTYYSCRCGGVWPSTCNTAYSFNNGVLSIRCENHCAEGCDIVPTEELYGNPQVPCFCDD